jgi:hypothetical protein
MFKFFTPIQVTLSGELHNALMAALVHNEANFVSEGDICKSAAELRKNIEKHSDHGVDGYGARYADMSFRVSEGAALIEQLAAYSYSMLNLLKQHNEVMKSTIALVNDCNSSLPALLSGTEIPYGEKAGEANG